MIQQNININHEVTFHEFNKLKLPISMDLAIYGTIRGQTQIEGATRYFIKNINNRFYEIEVSLDNLVNKVSIIGSSDLQWIDTKLSENSFKREIGKVTIHFLNGEIVLVKRQIPSPPFKKFRH